MKNYNKIAKKENKFEGTAAAAARIDETVTEVSVTPEVKPQESQDKIVNFEVLNSYVNLRAKPDKNSKVIKIMKKGTPLLLDESFENEEWAKVCGLEEGYMMKSCINEIVNYKQ